MSREKVGYVTEQEKEELRKMFERKVALQEIMPSLNPEICGDIDGLYEKVINDLISTNKSFQLWWKDKAIQYNWKAVEGGNWKIDFETNEVFLVTEF
jgi:CXXX repeat modification system protein